MCEIALPRANEYKILLFISLLPPLVSSLVDVEYKSARCTVLAAADVSDLFDAAKALAQFEYSLGALARVVVASQEATTQFDQATEAEEAFLVAYS